MRPAYYREQWEALKSNPDAARLRSLAHRIASSFVDRYFYSDEYNERYIELICEMATWFDDPNLNQIGARTLFGVIVERLCDDFEELQTETYNRLICQVAGFLRRLPAGARLDAQLNAFDQPADEQLYQRIEEMRLSPDMPLSTALRPKRILILSRVTIGADVAVTSVICQRVAQAYPQAEIVVMGNAKLRQIMAPASGIRIRELNYARHGGLIERFSVWLDLVVDVQDELAGLREQEYLVLDPDSRLTQLGVLPLVPDRNYRFFNSRGKQGYPRKGSISELTNFWMDNLLGGGDFCFPRVWLDADAMATAAACRKQLLQGGSRHLISLNLGVGGNLRKRVPGDFEPQMVLALLRDPQVTVILDMGFGEEERARSEVILAAARAAGLGVSSLQFARLTQPGELATLVADTVRVLGVECDVGQIGALIASSDEFIGYDSACQHIAAALGVCTYTVFAGTNNARFIRRWHACGSNISEILYVDTLSGNSLVTNPPAHNPLAGNALAGAPLASLPSASDQVADVQELIDRLIDLRSD